MKITHISDMTRHPDLSEHEDVIEKLLAVGSVNEYLFSECYYKIGIIPESNEERLGLIYRLLWETSYLHQNNLSKFLDSGNAEDMFELHLSLVDAIGFIRFATPPILQGNIQDSILTHESIKDVLSTILIDCGNEYHGYFKQFIRMSWFETVWQQEDSKIDMMWNTCKSDCVIVAEIYGTSFEKLYDGNLGYGDYTQFTLKCTDSGLCRMLDCIEDMSKLYVNMFRLFNIHHNKQSGCYMVSCGFIDPEILVLPQTVKTLIHDSYSKLM